jgi:hypothetical protein
MNQNVMYLNKGIVVRHKNGAERGLITGGGTLETPSLGDVSGTHRSTEAEDISVSLRESEKGLTGTEFLLQSQKCSKIHGSDSSPACDRHQDRSALHKAV